LNVRIGGRVEPFGAAHCVALNLRRVAGEYAMLLLIREFDERAVPAGGYRREDQEDQADSES